MHDVYLLSWLPGSQQLFRQPHHRIRVALDAAAMESRLHEAALLAVKLALRGQQAISQQKAQVAGAILVHLGKVTLLLGEEVAHVFRAETQHKGIFAYIKGCHTPIGAFHFAYKAKRVVLELQSVAY